MSDSSSPQSRTSPKPTSSGKKAKGFFSTSSPKVDTNMLQQAYDRERKLRMEHETTIQGLIEELTKTQEKVTQLQEEHDQQINHTLRRFQEHVDDHATNAAELQQTISAAESENKDHEEARAKQQEEIDSLRAELAIAKSKAAPPTIAQALHDAEHLAARSAWSSIGHEERVATIAEQMECLLALRDKMVTEVNWERLDPVAPPKNWTGIVSDKRGVKKMDLSGFGLDCDLSDFLPVLGPMLTVFKLYENLKLRGSINLLKGCDALKCVAMQHCEEIDGDLTTFKGFTKLGTLDLRFTSVTGNLLNLNSCAALRYIDVRETHVTGNIAVFSNCPTLQVALLGYSDVFGDLRVFEATRGLVYLDLTRCARITGNLSSLNKCVALQKLLISYTVAVREGGGDWLVTGDIAELSGCDNIVLVHLENTAVHGDVESFCACQSLQTLNLAHTRVVGDLQTFHAGFPLLSELNLTSTAFKGGSPSALELRESRPNCLVSI